MVCFHEYFVHIKRCIINGWGFCCIFGIRLSFGSQFKQNKHSITLWLRHHFNLVIKITPKIRGVPFTSWTVKTNINKTQHKMMGSQRHNEELQSSWWVENGSLDLNKNGSFHRFFWKRGSHNRKFTSHTSHVIKIFVLYFCTLSRKKCLRLNSYACTFIFWKMPCLQ